jgi:mannose-6-phosphate isomerase-like protein (cupin superfamily)
MLLGKVFSGKGKMLVGFAAGAVVTAAGMMAFGWSRTATVAAAPAPSQAIAPVEITHDQIAALLSTFPKTGEQVKVVGIGAYNVAVSLQRRTAVKMGAPVNSISHGRITEIYYIVSGSGTMVTDGNVPDAKDMDPKGDVVAIAAGPSKSGVMTGGNSRNLSAGDVVVVPPNTPHGWSQIDDQVSYLMFRTDPDKVLPAGWVNPNLK